MRKQVLVVFFLLAVFCSCDCTPGPAPFEQVLKNDTLVKFVERNFNDFLTSMFDESEVPKIRALIPGWDDFVKAAASMQVYCKPSGLKVMYFERYLYRDKGWKQKWKIEYEKYFPKLDPLSNDYLNGLVMVIKVGYVPKIPQTKIGAQTQTQTKTAVGEFK